MKGSETLVLLRDVFVIDEGGQSNGKPDDHHDCYEEK